MVEAQCTLLDVLCDRVQLLFSCNLHLSFGVLWDLAHIVVQVAISLQNTQTNTQFSATLAVVMMLLHALTG
jgi:hypothetical protein